MAHAVSSATVTVETLAQQAVFRGEQEDLLRWLLPHTQLRLAAAGTLLLDPQHPTDQLFLILHGEVEVQLGPKARQGIARLRAGHCVGEMSVLEGVAPSARVSVVEAATVIAIEGPAFRTLLDHSRVVPRNLLRLLSRRLRNDNLLVRQSLELRAQSEQHARSDPLTGLLNRRWLDESLPLMLQRHALAGRTLCLLMLDVDHFKRYNDSVGHLAGDRALQSVAQALQANVRTDDRAVRFGGEEFLVLLPDTALQDAAPIGERLRSVVENTAIRGSDGTALPGVTLSIGLTQTLPGESAEQLIARADAALYKAKHSGRNKVVVVAE